MDPKDDRPSTLIGTKPSQYFGSTNAESAKLTETWEPWSLRVKEENLYQTFPPGNHLFEGEKYSFYNLVTLEDLTPVSIRAIKIRIKQCVHGMLTLLNKAKNERKLSDKLFKETNSILKSIQQESSTLAKANPEIVLKLRDRVVDLFNNQFLEVLKQRGLVSASSSNQLPSTGYDLPDTLNIFIGDLLASYRYDYSSTSTTRRIAQQYHFPGIDLTLDTAAQQDNEKKASALLLGLAQQLTDYASLRSRARSSYEISRITSIHWVRLYEAGNDPQKKGYEVLVISTSGGYVADHLSFRQIVKNISPNAHFDIRPAPRLNPNEPLRFPHFFDKDKRIKGHLVLRSTDAEYSAYTGIANMIEALSVDGKELHGTIWEIASARPCGTCSITANLFEQQFPNIKICQTSVYKVLTKEDLELWDESEKNVNPSMHADNADDTLQIDMVFWSKIIQQRREAAIKISELLEDYKGEKIDAQNIKFLPWPYVGNLKNRPIFRIKEKRGNQEHPFVYIETVVPGHFVRVSPKVLKIKPGDKVVSIGKTEAWPEESSSSAAVKNIGKGEDNKVAKSSHLTFSELFREAYHRDATTDSYIVLQRAKPNTDYELLAKILISSEDWEGIISLHPLMTKDFFDDIEKVEAKKRLLSLRFPKNKSNALLAETQAHIETAIQGTTDISSLPEAGKFLSIQSTDEEIALLKLIKQFFIESNLLIPEDVKSGNQLIDFVDTASDLDEEILGIKKQQAIKLLEHADVQTTDRIVNQLGEFRKIFSGCLFLISQTDSSIFNQIKRLLIAADSYRKKLTEDRIAEIIRIGFKSYLEKHSVPQIYHEPLQSVMNQYLEYQRSNRQEMPAFDILVLKTADYAKFIETINAIKKNLTAIQVKQIQDTEENVSIIKSEVETAILARHLIQAIDSPYGHSIPYTLTTSNGIGSTLVTAKVKKANDDICLLRTTEKGINYLAFPISIMTANLPAEISNRNLEEYSFAFKKSDNGSLEVNIVHPYQALQTKFKTALNDLSGLQNIIDQFLTEALPSEEQTHARQQLFAPLLDALRQEKIDLHKHLLTLQKFRIRRDDLALIRNFFLLHEHKDFSKQVIQTILLSQKNRKSRLESDLQITHDSTHELLEQLNPLWLSNSESRVEQLWSELNRQLTNLTDLWQKTQATGIEDTALLETIEQKLFQEKINQEKYRKFLSIFKANAIYNDLIAIGAQCDALLIKLGPLVDKIKNLPIQSSLIADLQKYIIHTTALINNSKDGNIQLTQGEDHLAQGQALIKDASNALPIFMRQFSIELENIISTQHAQTVTLLEQLTNATCSSPSEVLRQHERQSLFPLMQSLESYQQSLQRMREQLQEQQVSANTLMKIEADLGEWNEHNLSQQAATQVQLYEAAWKIELLERSATEQSSTQRLLIKLSNLSYLPEAISLLPSFNDHLTTLSQRASHLETHQDLQEMQDYLVSYSQQQLPEKVTQLRQKKAATDLKASYEFSTTILTELEQTYSTDNPPQNLNALKADLIIHLLDTQRYKGLQTDTLTTSNLDNIDIHLQNGTSLHDAIRQRQRANIRKNLQEELTEVTRLISQLNLLTSALKNPALFSQSSLLIMPLDKALREHQSRLNTMLQETQAPISPNDLAKIETYLTTQRNYNYPAQVTQLLTAFKPVHKNELENFLTQEQESANQLQRKLNSILSYQSATRWNKNREAIIWPLKQAIKAHTNRLSEIEVQINQSDLLGQAMRSIENSMIQQQNYQQQLERRVLQLHKQQMTIDLKETQHWARQAQLKLDDSLTHLNNDTVNDGILLRIQLAAYLRDTQAHLATINNLQSFEALEPINIHLKQKRSQRFLSRLQSIEKEAFRARHLQAQSFPLTGTPPVAQIPQFQSIQQTQLSNTVIASDSIEQTDPPASSHTSRTSLQEQSQAAIDNQQNQPVMTTPSAPTRQGRLRRWYHYATRHLYIGRVALPDQTTVTRNAIEDLKQKKFPNEQEKFIYLPIEKNELSKKTDAIFSVSSVEMSKESVSAIIEEKAITAFNKHLAGHFKGPGKKIIGEWPKDKKFAVEDPLRLNFQDCSAIRIGADLNATVDYFLVTGIIRKPGDAQSSQPDRGILMRLTGSDLNTLNIQRVGEGERIQLRVLITDDIERLEITSNRSQQRSPSHSRTKSNGSH